MESYSSEEESMATVRTTSARGNSSRTMPWKTRVFCQRRETICSGVALRRPFADAQGESLSSGSASLSQEALRGDGHERSGWAGRF